VEHLLEHVFGRPVSIVADMEMRNDSTYSAYIEGSDLDDDEIAEVEEFIETGKTCWALTEKLLMCLIRMGFLEDGHYAINVSW